jgi:hypothetical protein
MKQDSRILSALKRFRYLILAEEQKPDSIYERRASDWTMPTREEMRRSAE